METLKKKRSLEEIVKILNLAKLNENDIKSTSQLLYFSKQNFYDHNYKLLQLNSYLSKEISEGGVLSIKGNDDDEIVICSENRTFHVTTAETSNSLLLTKNLKFSNDIVETEKNDHKINEIKVVGIFYEYLESTIGKPYLEKLNTLLNSSVYKGPEFECEVDNEKLLTFNELKDIIQASDKEVKDALASMDVVVVDGKIRLLDFEYHFRVLTFMLKLIEENSWQLDEIDFEQTINTLNDLVPKNIICYLFDKNTEESKIIDGLQLYKYKEPEVCKFFAKVLLHGTGKFNLNDFLQAWRESVPEGMSPNEKMLYGIAIIDRKEDHNTIWEFEESTLPHNIIERFKVLFDSKSKWTVPEIAPYIKRLATEEIDVNALLAKHARASTIDGVKYYSTKHGK